MIGKIVQVNDNAPQIEGLNGIVIDSQPDDGVNIRRHLVALVDGSVRTLTELVIDEAESDALAMIQLPPYPAIESDEDAERAALAWSKVSEIRDNNAARILAVEQDIQRQQAELAARIRGEHAELYRAQQVVGAVYDQHEQRNHNGALALWESKGRPEKGKRFGAVQIEERDYWLSFDPAAALSYCQTQAPNLVATNVDEKRFKAAVLKGILNNVPESVCKFEKRPLTKTLSSRLSNLTQGDE